MRDILLAVALLTLLSAVIGRGRAEEMNAAYQKATFAGGCFWGMEKYFGGLEGVVSTKVGYTGGHVKNPSYEKVCTGLTGHAEAIEITYDPSRVSYGDLLEFFFIHHDPTTLNRQGPDVGSQYRSAIFYHTPEQERSAIEAKMALDRSGIFKSSLVTEIELAREFYAAEEYHQKYLKKNPHGYCAIQFQSAKIKDILGAASMKIEIYNAKKGKIEKVDAVIKSDAEWKEILTLEQYQIMREAGTERAFSKQCAIPKSGKGIYQCVGCGTDLFAYDNKFESSTGWPSFWDPVSPLNVKIEEDNSFGMRRFEVLCARCGSHLGHVFDDGPPPTGKRYCINTVALKLSTE